MAFLAVERVKDGNVLCNANNFLFPNLQMSHRLLLSIFLKYDITAVVWRLQCLLSWVLFPVIVWKRRGNILAALSEKLRCVVVVKHGCKPFDTLPIEILGSRPLSWSPGGLGTSLTVRYGRSDSVPRRGHKSPCTFCPTLLKHLLSLKALLRMLSLRKQLSYHKRSQSQW